MEKGFFSFVGRRLASGPRLKSAQPASRRAVCLASAQPSPAPRWPASALACPLTCRAAPDRGRACPPRGGHAPSTPPRVVAGLRPRPRARLLLLEPVRSLAHSRAASPLRKHRAPSLSLSPRHRTRRQNPPRLLHLGPRSCARSSASLSGTSCSRLCRLLSPGSAASSPATVGHGAAVLGHHGRHLPALLHPA